MTTETIYVWGTQKTLEASGASCANTAIVPANDASYAVVADGASFPDATFELRLQFGVITAIENKTISLYVRSLNFDGTNDAPAPTATYLQKFVGNFFLQASVINTDQYLQLVGRDLPKEGDYYLVNNAGQTITAGWTLKVTPRSYKPA